MSQKDLANLMNVSEVTISRALSSEGNPTLNTLEKIASALEVKVSDLFYDRKAFLAVIIDEESKTWRFSSFEELKDYVKSRD